jgi:hypothetical protein
MSRRNGGYYSSVRDGDQVRSEYLGSGELGRMMMMILADGRQRQRENIRREIERCDRWRNRLARFCDLVEVMFRREMMARGFHQHDRSGWRRQRMATTPATTTAKAPERWPRTRDMKVLVAAERGDKKAQERFCKLMEDPKWRGVVIRVFGDVAKSTNDALVARIHPSALASRESLRARLRDLRAELAPKGTGPLEKLLVDRIVTCWLMAYYGDVMVARSHDGCPPRILEARAKIGGAAHRRFIQALRALTWLRRTPTPSVAIQINNAVGQPAAAGDDGRP